MKLGIFGVDALNKYSKTYYTFMLEMSAYHDVLKYREDVECVLCSVDYESELNYIKNKSKYPYDYNDYKITNYLDPSIDMYHFIELNSPNDHDTNKSYLLNIINTRKPIVYSDSDGEYSNRKRGGWAIKLPAGVFLIENSPQGQVTIHSTCELFASEYSNDFKVRSIYCPYILSKNMLRYFKPDSINKISDFVYIGSLTGRPHMIEFFKELSSNNIEVSLGTYHFDRMRLIGTWYKPVHQYVGLNHSRKEFYSFLSNYRFAFIGSGWFMKRDRPTSISNPSYSTFRMLEPIITRQLPFSYITPELLRMGVDRRLLIEWEGFKSNQSLMSKLPIIVELISNQDLYDKLLKDTLDKIYYYQGDLSYFSELLLEIFNL